MAITDAGLVVGTITIEYSSTVPSGYLISQSLEAGIEVGEGTTVDLVVSAGPQMTASPNVIGLSQTDAQATITDAGLLIGTVTMQYSSTVPVGYVMSQNPVPGTYLPMGSVVDVLVSSGPAILGACILPDGCCTQSTQEDCTDAGGTYQGDETECAATQCPLPLNPMECFQVHYMKVTDKKHSAKCDRIKIKGSLKLADGATCDPRSDILTVTINGEEIAIPAGSFKKKGCPWLSYYRFKGKIDGAGYVHMHLNLTLCDWWISISGKEASSLIDSTGATVALTIGNNTGTDEFFDWTKTKKWSKTRLAEFFEVPPAQCCRLCCKWH